MRLIVTEKDNSAKKIAEILSAGKAKQDKSYGIPVYKWGDNGDGAEPQKVIGLKGHLMNPAFPEDYSDWRKVEPRALIDAGLIKEPVQKAVHKALRKEAKDADSVVIATDYDREGELIGLEALEEIVDVNPKIAEQFERARFSALTKQEIESAFSNLAALSEPLARAGEARQDIDLIWGATLTRFISLATGRLGSQFLSVGRVQSPTLAIVVERELERRAHVPKPYWELFATFDHPDGEFTAHHTEDRFWGTNMFLLSTEFRMPVASNLIGVLFADYGDAWDAQSGLSIQNFPQHSGFRGNLGVGVGLRVTTPIGPIRLDYGIGREGGRTHFSIGHSF